MKRMLCLVSEQLMPNFIPVNEPATRPEALHGIYTPSDARMSDRWQLLKNIIANKFPDVQTEDVPVADAYNPHLIQQTCADLIGKFPDDDWTFNMTGGTKLMSSPAVEMFHRRGCLIYYVDTRNRQTLSVNADWRVQRIAFTQSLDIETYFGIYGRQVTFGNPQSGQEEHVYRQLQRLDWQVWPSVCLMHRGQVQHEYDAVGIDGYQCYFFECKRMSDLRHAPVSESRKDQARDDVLIDLLKLYQVRQSFGGPFGKSYWIFSGDYPLSEVDLARIRDCQITLIRGEEINQIAAQPKTFGLPARKPKPV